MVRWGDEYGKKRNIKVVLYYIVFAVFGRCGNDRSVLSFPSWNDASSFVDGTGYGMDPSIWQGQQSGDPSDHSAAVSVYHDLFTGVCAVGIDGFI